MPTIFSEKLFARFAEQFRPYLERLDIPVTVLTRHDIEIDDVKYNELLETVARESDPNLGLGMALALDPRDMGVLGYAISASNTIGQALRIFSRYLYVFSQSNTIRLDIAEQQAICSYTVTILQPDLVRQDAEFALGFVTRGILGLSGRRVSPRLVEFAHRRLPGAKNHEQLFGCDVAFERSANRIHFASKILDYPVLSADEGLLEALQFYLDDRLVTRSEDEDLLVKATHLITTTLTEGVPMLEQIAQRMNLSKRSLQRKLAEHGVVFSELVDSIYKPIAIDYVRNTDYSFTDISLMLGYSDLSAFSRAFKRWTGSSPQSVRQAPD